MPKRYKRDWPIVAFMVAVIAIGQRFYRCTVD